MEVKLIGGIAVTFCKLPAGEDCLYYYHPARRNVIVLDSLMRSKPELCNRMFSYLVARKEERLNTPWGRNAFTIAATVGEIKHAETGSDILQNENPGKYNFSAIELEIVGQPNNWNRLSKNKAG